MKVKQLLKELEKCNPESEVVMAKDEEGNGYSPLYEVDGENMVYTPDSTWSGDIFDKRWSPDDAGLEKSDHKKMMKKKVCVLLWPVN